VFLYYGHEIPESGGPGYDASYPDRIFTIRDLAVGLLGFTCDFARFDLLVLSTCFGGTPYTIGTLAPSARYIIASPCNLHLSYFDFQSLERLDLNVRDGEVSAFAGRFAHHAFDRLARDLQTEVSVAVYDVDRMRDFLSSVRSEYDRTTTAIEHCDCADLPGYELPPMREGVELFYRPARFGRLKQKQGHSGWECWREREPRTAASQVND
jgi:hypothetical protein